ncbi:hypothetical protein [uncultured Sphingomonas sp.]|uniref:hypothetical protein n=1 Tax=uncultured Sphingomonas sp. TaxID=158754 RepID=UPI0025D5A339|nr:hypothetical protein [uncultured Sphingomonas sp.]
MVRDPRRNRQRHVPGDHPRGIGRGQSKAIADQPGDLARQSGIATGDMNQRQAVMWDGRFQPLMFEEGKRVARAFKHHLHRAPL